MGRIWSFWVTFGRLSTTFGDFWLGFGSRIGSLWQLLESYFWSFGNFWEGFRRWPPTSQKLTKSCQKLRSNIRPGPQKLPTGCAQLSKSWSKVAQSSKVTFGKVSKSFQKSTRGARASKGLHAGRSLDCLDFGNFWTIWTNILTFGSFWELWVTFGSAELTPAGECRTSPAKAFSF